MKQAKRVLALTGAIVLASLYIIALILAVIDNSQSMNMFIAAIAATVIVPVLLWVYSWMYKLIQKSAKDKYENLSIEKETEETQDSL